MALSADLRTKLNHAFKNRGDFGPKAGPGRDAMRGLLLDAVESGFSEDTVAELLNPFFYRGINDPYGRGGLLEDLDTETIAALINYAKGCTKMSARESQAAFFDAFPDMLARYEHLAGD